MGVNVCAGYGRGGDGGGSRLHTSSNTPRQDEAFPSTQMKGKGKGERERRCRKERGNVMYYGSE